jgi:hypothetical protein
MLLKKNINAAQNILSKIGGISSLLLLSVKSSPGKAQQQALLPAKANIEDNLPKYIVYAMFYSHKFISKNPTLFNNDEKDVSEIKHVNNVIGLLYTHLQLKFKSTLQSVSGFKPSIIQHMITTKPQSLSNIKNLVKPTHIISVIPMVVVSEVNIIYY